MQYAVWVVLALLVLSAITAVAAISRTGFLAVLHDTMPVNLVLAWVALLYGLVTGNWPVVAVAASLAVFQVVLLAPRVVARPVPRWVESAPNLTIGVANVFVGNRTSEAAVAGLMNADADVLVVTERNEEYRDAFGRAGGSVAYPHLVDEPSPRPDYEIAIASRLELSPHSQVVTVGSLRLVRAVIRSGQRDVTIVGVHLSAVTEPQGFRQWRHEMDALTTYLAGIAPPFVVAGDFNATHFRPAFTRPVRSVGLIDAHRSRGKGLTGSLKFAAHGVFARLPALGRVDHALLSDGLAATRLRNLPAAGSDHHPFVITVAVRQD